MFAKSLRRTFIGAAMQRGIVPWSMTARTFLSGGSAAFIASKQLLDMVPLQVSIGSSVSFTPAIAGTSDPFRNRSARPKSERVWSRVGTGVGDCCGVAAGDDDPVLYHGRYWAKLNEFNRMTAITTMTRPAPTYR